MKRIGVLLGGWSAERDVSIKTGEAVVEALRARGHDVQPVYVDRDLDRALRATPIDVAFLALHGRYGEDGCVQGMLECMGIPYTGSSVLASALAMDKLKAKELFRLHNVPTPPYYALHGDVTAGELESQHGSFGFPVVVKPRREGSSIGVSKANSFAELAAAVELAQRSDRSVIVERYIKGREVQVGILNGRVLGAVEVVPKRALFDYQSKYTAGMTEYFYPARLAPTRYQGALRLAERAAQSLDCRGAVRVDMIVTEGENEYVLEIDTTPGMTATSLLPKIAAGCGMDFGSLCEAILSSAQTTYPVARAGREMVARA
ncbi:MAG: D-alanine--D-alanine ligase [Deltaproteobacteria bacterium]|nr:D-alanine--D-alanine ligase [Deltaproteobacteria bacterium]